MPESPQEPADDLRIHADLSQIAIVDSNALPWVPSSVWRVWSGEFWSTVAARLPVSPLSFGTRPGGAFPSHLHSRGAETYVLQGESSDEHGDYSRGAYIRSPRGPRHASFSIDGCLLLVKLRQIEDPAEPRTVVDSEFKSWRNTEVAGIDEKLLYRSAAGTERVALQHWVPGTKISGADGLRGWEILILQGTLQDERQSYAEGWWLRFPGKSAPALHSRTGCQIWTKSGHLPAD